jgi:tRNA (Thr-GGU) A37 N-methylase
MTLCKIVAVKENVVEVEKIDAFDDTPVIDIKPYLPGYDTADDATVPEWLQRAFEKRQAQKKGT